MSSIANSISTLLGKGYTQAEIDAIRFGVPKGGNRRKNALAYAASTLPQKPGPAPAAPPAPTQQAAPEKTQLKSSLKASGGGVRANRLSKRRKRGQANAVNALANYIPLLIGSVGYSGSANIA